MTRSEAALACGVFLEGKRYPEYTFSRNYDLDTIASKVKLKWLDRDLNKAMYAVTEGTTPIQYYCTATFDKSLPKALTPQPYRIIEQYGITQIDCLYYAEKLIRVTYE